MPLWRQDRKRHLQEGRGVRCVREVQGWVQESRVHGLLEQRVQCLLIVTTGKEYDEVGGWVDKARRR